VSRRQKGPKRRALSDRLWRVGRICPILSRMPMEVSPSNSMLLCFVPKDYWAQRASKLELLRSIVP